MLKGNMVNSIDWTFEDAAVATWAMPILRYDEDVEYSVYATPVSTLQNAFLYTDSDYTNIIEAKRFSQVVYTDVGIYSSSPSCFIGSLDAGVATGINVRLNFSTASLWGEQSVPIYLGGGPDIVPLAAPYTDPFWDSGYNPSLWEEDLSTSSLWSWIDSV